MTAMQVAQRMTADEFIAAPVPEHGRPWNLVGGEVVVTDPPPVHAYVQMAILGALLRWVDSSSGSGTLFPSLDVKIDDHNVFIPDTMWYADGREPAPGDEPPSPMPDIAVEIRSRSTWRYDVGAKRAGYERAGLPELWLVDTEAQTILALRRSRRDQHDFDISQQYESGDELTSPQLPDFSIDVDAVFAKVT